MKIEAEVLIVGGGPSGAALALRLARAGHDVLVLEARDFPRDKPCGDSVNPGAVSELQRLGLAAPLWDRLGPTELAGWKVEAPDGSRLETRFDAGSGSGAEGVRGWAIRRRDLDAGLLEAARREGARVGHGLRTFDVLWSSGRVAGVRARQGASVLEIGARLTVGADGLRSVVRRRLGLGRRRAASGKLALVAHLREGDLGIPGAGKRGDGTVRSASFGEMYVREGFCVGFSPAAGGANITLVVPAREARRISAGPRDYVLGRLAADRHLRHRFEAVALEPEVMVTGPFDVPVRRAWVPGAVLVGDAAGYYDPFTGQGVYRALRSAALAAATISRALAAPERGEDFFGSYNRRLRREFTVPRALQRIIEGVIRRPGLMSWFVRRLGRDGGSAGRRLLRVTGDLDSPIGLLGFGFWGALLSP